MSIYDMLDTIAEDTKARYITRIVDTGDAYVVNVCDVGGKPVFAHPYQYPYKPDAKKVTLLDSEWYKKYSEGKVLYENEVILAAKLFSRFYGGSGIWESLEESDMTRVFLNLAKLDCPPISLDFNIPNFTVTKSSFALVREIEEFNCHYDESYITRTDSPVALELIYGEVKNKSNLLFSLIYAWYNQESSTVYEVKRTSDNASVGYIQISSIDSRIPYLSVGTRLGTCSEIDNILIFAHAITSICKHRYYRGVNYICNADNKARVSTMKYGSCIPSYTVDLNAGPKLNIYFLVNASGKEIISEVSLNQQLGLLFND